MTLEPALAIDVGANYGEFSIQAAGRIPLLAVEANPVIYRLLEKNLHGHRDVMLVNAAASDRSGEMILYVRSGYTGGSSLSEEVVSGIGARHTPKSATIKEERIEVLTVDEMLRDRYPQSVILKIDVEGFEREVFDGAAEMLRRASWWRALIEFDSATLEQRGVSVEETWARFAQYPGVIIGRTMVPEEWLESPNGRLPIEPMSRANLLLGEGAVAAE